VGSKGTDRQLERIMKLAIVYTVETMFETRYIKIGQNVRIGSDSIFTRKYCAVCETYFGIATKVTRCPCCNDVHVVP